MNGRATFSRTERIGTRLKNWKTNPVFWRRSFVAASSPRRLTTAPSRTTSPDVGRSRPPRRWRRVLFPDPDGPMTATNSPGSTASDTPRTAATSAAPIR
jgi:hypothetical protein